jgi:hypothetical protein
VSSLQSLPQAAQLFEKLALFGCQVCRQTHIQAGVQVTVLGRLAQLGHAFATQTKHLAVL